MYSRASDFTSSVALVDAELGISTTPTFGELVASFLAER